MRIQEDLNSVFSVYRVEGRIKTQILKYKGMAGRKAAEALAHKLNNDAKSILAYRVPVKFEVVEEEDL